MPKVYKCSSPDCNSISNSTNEIDDPFLYGWIRVRIKMGTLVKPEYSTDPHYIMSYDGSYIPKEYIKLHCCSVDCVRVCLKDEVMDVLVDMMNRSSDITAKYENGKTQNKKKQTEI